MLTSTSTSTCPTLRRIESIKEKTLCPGLFYNNEKPFAFGRLDTLKGLGITRTSQTYNTLQVDVWDEQSNTAYLQCAMACKRDIHIFFGNKENKTALSDIFTSDLTRDKTTECNTVFAHELAQFMISGYNLSDRLEESQNVLQYTLTKGSVFLQEDTDTLKGVLTTLFPNLQLGAGKRKVTILGKTRNIHYIRAKNGRLVEYVKYEGNLVALRSLKAKSK